MFAVTLYSMEYAEQVSFSVSHKTVMLMSMVPRILAQLLMPRDKFLICYSDDECGDRFQGLSAIQCQKPTVNAPLQVEVVALVTSHHDGFA